MLTAPGDLRTTGRPPRKRVQRYLVGAGILALILFLLFEIVAPYLISSTVVRQSMEGAVGRWTGHEVRIEGTTEIRFWPKPRITIADVTIRKSIAGGGERVLGHVARLSAAFDLLGALRGHPQFQDFRLTTPQIHVMRDAAGRLDWASDGLLSRAVSTVRANGPQQVLDPASDAEIGEIRISNGLLEIADAGGKTIRLENIDGTVDWPALSLGMRLKARARFQDQPLQLDIGTAQPLLLFSGRSADTIASVQSTLFSGSFNGVANLAAHGFISGDADISIPDLPGLLKWAALDLAAAADLKTLSMKARLISNETALRFEELALGLNDITATGILDLSLPEGKRPRLTGTLAVGNIDFSPVAQTLGKSIIDGSEDARQLRSRMELDVRLSAQHAVLGPFELGEVALGIMNIGEQSRLDILDSDFETGRLTGRIATSKSGTNDAVAVRLMVHDADFANIIPRLKLHGPLPAGRGSMEIALDVARPLTPLAWRDAQGSVRLTMGPGIIPRLDLPALRQLAAQKPYFPLSDAAGADLPFQSLQVTADLRNGSADIRSGEIATAEETITLAGVIPYVNNSLALSSMIHPLSPSVQPFGFFIGGSWPDPVIWPLPEVQPRPAD